MIQENHWGYAKRLRFVLEHMSRAFPTRKDLAILDVGCGNGSQLAIPLAEMGFKVTAVDPHEESIEQGRRLSLRVDFRCMDVGELPVKSFDVVIVSEVLEHLPSPVSLLLRAVEKLKEDGLLIVTFPNGYGEFEFDRRLYQGLKLDRFFALAAQIARFLLRRPPKAKTIASSEDESPHLQRFTLPSAKRLFAECGLRIVDRRATSVASGPMAVLTVGRLPGYIQLNARLADVLPMWMSSAWMFALRKHDGAGS